MNKNAKQGFGNVELSNCKHFKALAGEVLGLWLAEFLVFLFASLIEVPLVVRVPQGKKLCKTGRVDTEV